MYTHTHKHIVNNEKHLGFNKGIKPWIMSNPGCFFQFGIFWNRLENSQNFKIIINQHTVFCTCGSRNLCKA